MKRVSNKKYLLLIIIFIIVAFLTAIINNVIRNYNYVKADKSPLESYISKVNINELDIALSELNETIIYVSYKHDKDIWKLDKELIKKIKLYGLENYIYYCDVTDRLEDNKYIGDFITIIPSINGKLKRAPSLIYFKNGDAIEVINSNDKLITSDQLIYLVDKYKVGK